MSRAPVESSSGKEREKYDVFHLENQEVESTKEREFVSVSDQRMEAIKKAALHDPEQCGLRRVLGQGWPSNISQVSLPLRPYWNVRDCLTVQDGVIYKGGQVVVPSELRGQILQRLHVSHQGTEIDIEKSEGLSVLAGNDRRCKESVFSMHRL